MKKSSARSKFVPLSVMVAVALALTWLVVSLNIRANKSIKSHRQVIETKSPLPSPTPNPTAQDIPLPSSQKATEFVTKPFPYGDLSWTKLENINRTDLDSLATYQHASYSGWQAVVTQSNGQANIAEYFDNGIFASYKREFSSMNWELQEVADGPTGGVRKFTGVINGKAQELILSFEINNDTGCGSGGCVCPCRYTYSVYLSSVDET